jgi:hypothetical protein
MKVPVAEKTHDGETVEETSFRLTGVNMIATDAELDYNQNVDYSGNGVVIGKVFDARTGKLSYTVKVLEATLKP